MDTKADGSNGGSFSECRGRCVGARGIGSALGLWVVYGSHTTRASCQKSANERAGNGSANAENLVWRRKNTKGEVA